MAESLPHSGPGGDSQLQLAQLAAWRDDWGKKKRMARKLEAIIMGVLPQPPTRGGHCPRCVDS